MKRIASANWFLFLSVLIISIFLVGCYEEEQIIAPSDALNARSFANAVDIDGDYALTGDKDALYGDGVTMDDTGSAHLYHFDGNDWIELYKFRAADPEPNGEFGYAVAIGSNHAIVGAPQDVNSGIKSGSVFFLRRFGNAWIKVQEIASPFNELNCYFGQSVDISGSYAIVGAPLADTSNGSNTGAAAIYRFNGYYWYLYKTLKGSDSVYGDWFGHSVKINGNYAVVGAPYDDTQRGYNGGSAYVFRRSSGWIQSDKLVPSGSTAYAMAGFSVALNNNYVLVGAPYENNEMGSRAGAIYIFENQNGACDQVNRFAAPYSYDEAGVQNFGYAVDLINDVAVAGAPQTFHGAGIVHVFGLYQGSWMYLEELTGSQAVSSDTPKFGASVAVNGEYAIFGAPGQKNTGGLETGSAYIFKQDQ